MSTPTDANKIHNSFFKIEVNNRTFNRIEIANELIKKINDYMKRYRHYHTIDNGLLITCINDFASEYKLNFTVLSKLCDLAQKFKDQNELGYAAITFLAL